MLLWQLAEMYFFNMLLFLLKFISINEKVFYSFSYNPSAVDLNTTDMSQTLIIPVLKSLTVVVCFVSECFM